MGVFRNKEKEKTMPDSVDENETGKSDEPEEKQKSWMTNVEEEQEIISPARKGESNNREILNILSNLKEELAEFEKIKKVMTTKIEATSALIPQLTEKRELLLKQVNEKQRQITEIDELVPKLEEKKQNLDSYLSRRKEELELIEKDIHEKQEKNEEISQLIPKLQNNRKKIDETMKERNEEISKIDEQIEQIRHVQKYGVDLLSTLMYAKKGKE
jgi:chromosome segregation ATPase